MLQGWEKLSPLCENHFNAIFLEKKKIFNQIILLKNVTTLHQKPILSYLADPCLFYSEVKYE